MSSPLRIDGMWPSPVVLSRGWARATARPWNDDIEDAFLRLERGSQAFLQSATRSMAQFGLEKVLSPALYPGTTRLWEKCGYEEVRRLTVMERSLSLPIESPPTPVAALEPDWVAITRLDQSSFSGFWRMSLSGLQEALNSTTKSAVLCSMSGSELAGYAIVGAQWGVSYLQRIAVGPGHRGQNIGSSLVRASLRWGRGSGSQVMILNVRTDNQPARGLYEKEGFTDTGTSLRILSCAL
ncbi:MAG: GNAT family N-acetyltransferase [Acidimicrobiia bacterium]